MAGSVNPARSEVEANGKFRVVYFSVPNSVYWKFERICRENGKSVKDVLRAFCRAFSDGYYRELPGVSLDKSKKCFEARFVLNRPDMTKFMYHCRLLNRHVNDVFLSYLVSVIDNGKV